MLKLIDRIPGLHNARTFSKTLLTNRALLTSKGKIFFNPQWYNDEYLECKTNKMGALQHFLKHGIDEGNRPNFLFDPKWYCSQYPDVLASGLSPIIHFIIFGSNEGRKPHPFFDVQWYLKYYKDVLESGMHPLYHFLKHGEKEGRNPNPYFDSHWYSVKYPDVAKTGLSPLQHYLKFGIHEGKNPHPYLDMQWYINEYTDVQKKNMLPIYHYIEYGIKEDRNPNPYFDAKWYKEQYPDVSESGLQPFEHYQYIGIKEKLNPNQYFDVKWYLNEYSDIAHCGIDPLLHYLHYGESEGRKTSYSPIIPGYALARNGRPSATPMVLNQPRPDYLKLSFDLILVTYNSSKWIDNCFASLIHHNTQLNITVVDNNSSDDTLSKLELFKSKFTSFNIIKNEVNMGFGAANNLGARSAKGSYLFFLNIDTETHDVLTFEKLESLIHASTPDVVAWELRQLPYEHPKCYDPVSLESSWFSGAAVVVRRDAFEKIGGFDENLFMYCEDVDLSWRLKAEGYRLLYCPSVTITHHSYTEPGEVKPVAQVYGVKHNYFLRCRFGTDHDKKVGQSLLLRYMQYAKSALSHENYSKLINTEEESIVFSQSKVKSSNDFVPLFDQFEYEIAREGGFYVSKLSQQTSTVSIIIRTIGNLHYLEKAIYSVINQTYKNIELVIVEDGSNKAQNLISQFKNFNIVYKPVEKMGRCNAGNVGLEAATGDFFNFLDEDDLLFCDHVETLINAISVNPACGAVWSSAFSIQTEVSEDKCHYYERNYTLGHTVEPDNKTILVSNYFPIQAVLFRRECYDKLGGFDPEINLLEDWDLWIRYFKDFEFCRIPKTTSLYRVPFENDNYTERKEAMQKFYECVQKKHL
ncbi:MAG: GT2 family glycosyltransferase [Desulforhopalus sp.]|jgi:GT2 family glycosyltransferase